MAKKKDDGTDTLLAVGAIGVVGFFVLRMLLQADAPRPVPQQQQAQGPR